MRYRLTITFADGSTTSFTRSSRYRIEALRDAYADLTRRGASLDISEEPDGNNG